MKLTVERLRMPLARPFTISRGTREHQDSVIVRLSDGERGGLGEATANPYYGHTADSICQTIERVRPIVESYDFGSPKEFWQALEPLLSEDYFALSALDIAACDLFGRRQGQRCFEQWGLDGSSIPDSSYTIAIDPVDVMVEKLHAQAGWGCYKIKLGMRDEIEVVQRLRNETDAVFRVDANCAWSAKEAVEKSHVLAELGVEFIEQPLPADASDADMQYVFERSALPVIADENCIVRADVHKCAGRFHGINVKLNKCGGLTPAIEMLRQARKLGMKTMVGCMVESSVGVSAAAQLLPLLDYADLDGALLLKEDPATGVTIERGSVSFPDSLGCGAELQNEIVDRLRYLDVAGQPHF